VHADRIAVDGRQELLVFDRVGFTALFCGLALAASVLGRGVSGMLIRVSGAQGVVLAALSPLLALGFGVLLAHKPRHAAGAVQDRLPLGFLFGFLLLPRDPVMDGKWDALGCAFGQFGHRVVQIKIFGYREARADGWVGVFGQFASVGGFVV
jgi:hypothetical protein